MGQALWQRALKKQPLSDLWISQLSGFFEEFLFLSLGEMF
jgi:uncharacterized membrane protein